MLIYGLSAADDVIFTAPGWDDFARRNGGEGALRERVAGRPLWDFVNGVATRRFLERVFFTCRRSGEAATMVYRCDGPGVERLYCQHILPGAAGALRLESHLVRSRCLPLMTLAVARTDWRRCSICLSVSTDGGWWQHPARAPAAPPALWTVCPACERGAVSYHRAPAPMVPA